MQESRNIAARAGRWSARHRKTAIIGWITFVVLAFMVGGKVGTKTLDQEQSGVGESGKARRSSRAPTPRSTTRSVLIQSKDLKDGLARVSRGRRRRREAPRGDRRAWRQFTAPTTRRKRRPSPATAIRRWSASRSRATPKDAAVEGDGRRDASPQTEAAQKAHRDFSVEQSGAGSSEERVQGDLQQGPREGDVGSLPITLILLVIAFGALVAAGIPLLLAITGIMATMGLVGPLSQLAPVEESVNHVILLIGLAVGVDYALFYLRRVREERAAGRDNEAAIEAAAATSGRAVLVSGITVMIAMAGMYFAGAATFTSFATGTIAVVAVAMLGSLTVLPAMLSLLGDRVEKGRVPGLGRIREPGGQDRHLVAHRGPRAASPAAVGRAGHRRAGGARDPGAAHGDGNTQHGRIAAAGRAGRPDVQPAPGGVPDRDLGAGRGRQGQGRDGPRRHPRDRRSSSRPRREHRRCFPATTPRSTISPDKTVATVSDGDRRRRDREGVRRIPGRAPGRTRAGDARVRSTAWRPTSTARPRRIATSTTR